MIPHSTSAARTNARARSTERSLASISMRSRHGGADLAEAVGRAKLRDDLPREHDHDAIADIEELVEIGGNEEDPATARPRLAQRAPHESSRPDIEPARRLRGDDERRVGVDLPGEDQ